eukprot:714881-Hanusia_phi.AAC.1
MARRTGPTARRLRSPGPIRRRAAAGPADGRVRSLSTVRYTQCTTFSITEHCKSGAPGNSGTIGENIPYDGPLPGPGDPANLASWHEAISFTAPDAAEKVSDDSHKACRFEPRSHKPSTWGPW